MKFKVEVHIGPVRSDAADSFLERLRAYRGDIRAGGAEGDAQVCFDGLRVPQHVAREILDVLVQHHINSTEEE